MRILGIDPGLAIVGFGLFEAETGKTQMLQYGAVTTPAGLPLAARLVQLERDMEELIAQLQTQYPDLKSKIFGAMQRLPLPQWGVTPHPRGSQKQLHQHDGCKAGQAEKADDAGRGRGDRDIEPGQGRE